MAKLSATSPRCSTAAALRGAPAGWPYFGWAAALRSR
ncbi:hypothetical protein RKD35_001981 [Streptomyces albogriseolus]